MAPVASVSPWHPVLNPSTAMHNIYPEVVVTPQESRHDAESGDIPRQQSQLVASTYHPVICEHINPLYSYHPIFNPIDSNYIHRNFAVVSDATYVVPIDSIVVAPETTVRFTTFKNFLSKNFNRFKKAKPTLSSDEYPDLRWVDDEKGDEVKKASKIFSVRPEMGGPSQLQALNYGKDEERPRKIFENMDAAERTGLLFVDRELYAHLKMHAMVLGVSANTYPLLQREAVKFLRKYRIDAYDPNDVNDVINWTVAYAIQPTQSELDSIKMLSKRKIFAKVNKVSAFKRSGVSSQSRFFGLFKTPLSFNKEI